MIKKISNFIVNKRVPILVFMLVLAICSMICSQFVEVNEDMTKYLPDSSNMKHGMDIMESEFPEIETSNTIRVMFDNLNDSQKADILEQLTAIPYVDSVDYDIDSPDYNRDNHTLYVLNFSYDYGSEDELKIESELDTAFTDYTMIWLSDNSDLPAIPIHIIAVVMVILMTILFVMCGSWIEPILFLLTIGIAVVINSGTNLIMGSVASITNSIGVILQLVLSIDYSIILMNRYRQEKELESDKVKAMKKALANAFSSIASSSLTTVVGLLMLVFMSFKIGADLGIVLAKGVFISMVCVLTVLPGILLAFDKLIVKTAKKEPKIPMDWAAKFSYKMRYVMSGFFVILFISAYLLQQQTGIAYTLVKSDPIADVFPKSNMLVMVYENQDEGAVNKLVEELEEDKNVKSVMGYSTILGKPYTSSELADALHSMDESISLNSSIIDMLYYDYYHGGELGTMTASQFLTFISDTVLNDETFSEYVDDDMKENIEMLNNFADADTLTSPMNSRQLAEFFDMDEANIKDLFLLYYIQNGGVSTESMTLPVFLDFVINEVAHDPAYGSMFDQGSIEKLTMFSTFTKKEIITAPRSTAEIASMLSIDENMVNTIFMMYYNGATEGTTLSLKDTVDFILNTPMMTEQLDAMTLGQLKMMQTFMNSTVNNTAFSAEQMAAMMGMNTEQANQLYLLYTSRHGDTSGWTLSVQSFIDFVLDDVLTNSAYASELDEETSESLSSARIMINAVISGKAYTAVEMSNLFCTLSDDMEPSMIELLYLYAESIENRNPSQTITLEALFNYLLDDVLNDSRFESVIEPDMRQTLLDAQESLDDGKAQLVTDNYSRLIITTSYPEEGTDTSAFLAGLEEYAGKNLNGNYYLVGSSAMNHEMQKTFDREFMFITLLTAAAIFLIVALTFKSISIPAILVLLVQCGVYITVTVTGVLSGSMYYLALLIVECILMGATIDYGILFANYYREYRKLLDVKESLKKAYTSSIHTIMTSGLILVTVTGVVGGMFEEQTVQAIVKTLSIGSFCAIVLIMFILPGILAVTDKFVIKKKQ